MIFQCSKIKMGIINLKYSAFFPLQAREFCSMKLSFGVKEVSLTFCYIEHVMTSEKYQHYAVSFYLFIGMINIFKYLMHSFSLSLISLSLYPRFFTSNACHSIGLLGSWSSADISANCGYNVALIQASGQSTSEHLLLQLQLDIKVHQLHCITSKLCLEQFCSIPCSYS